MTNFIEKIPVCAFLGNSGSSFFKNLDKQFQKYQLTNPIRLINILPKEFSLQKIKDNSISLIVIDLQINPTNYTRVLREIDFFSYPKKIITIGIDHKIDSDKVSWAQKIGLNFLYQNAGDILEETIFLRDTIINCLYNENSIKRDLATAKLGHQLNIETVVSVNKISQKEICFDSLVKINEPAILNINQAYLKKINWRETNLTITKIENKKTIIPWTTTIKPELIKPSELDRFETEFSQKYPMETTDEFKKNKFLSFVQPILIEKKQNLISIYRKIKFNLEVLNKKNIIFFSNKNLNFNLKETNIIDNFILHKKANINLDLDILKNTDPYVIFFDLEPEMEEEPGTIGYNNFKALAQLAAMIDKSNLKANIFVFNPESFPIKHYSASIYDLQCGFDEKVVFNVLNSFLNKESKQKKEIERIEPALLLSPKNQASFGTVEFSAKLESLTENEVIIQTSAEIPDFTFLKASAPFNFYFTIIPNKKIEQKNKQLNRYYGIINGIDSESRDQLRRFVITFNL